MSYLTLSFLCCPLMSVSLILMVGGIKHESEIGGFFLFLFGFFLFFGSLAGMIHFINKDADEKFGK